MKMENQKELMDYEEFQEMLIKRLSHILGNDFEVKIQDKVKINQENCCGICILNPERGITPENIIYVDSLYEEYVSGISIEDIMEEVLLIIEDDEDRERAGELIFLPENREKLKRKIYPWLINTEANVELLKDVPNVKFTEDLSIIFVVRFQQSEDKSVTMKVDNNIQTITGIETEELFQIALHNLSGDDYRLFPIEKLLLSFMLNRDEYIEECDEEIHVEYNRMTVLMNKDKQYGAAGIISKAIRRRIVNCYGTDVYILPSSLHELIFISALAEITEEDLRTMVREINREKVKRDEFLSDNIYLLHADTLEVELLCEPD